MAYYDNVNPDLLASIPLNAQKVLEIGCGKGNFGRAYKEQNPTVEYTGVELFKDAALHASKYLDHVICGDIEQTKILAKLEKSLKGKKFDTLIFGDVLEHLMEPSDVLKNLYPLVANGGMCIACVPNVGHWTLLQQLLKGRWDYADSGLLDRTHLRFFTLETTVELFQNSGWTVLDAKSRILWPEETEIAIKNLLYLADPLGITAQKMHRDLSAFQWVIRAVKE